MIVRSLLFAVLLIAASPRLPSGGGAGPRVARDPARLVLARAAPRTTRRRSCTGRDGANAGGAVARCASRRGRGGDTSALAHLAAGLVLLDLNRPAEALAELEDRGHRETTPRWPTTRCSRARWPTSGWALCRRRRRVPRRRERDRPGPRRCAALLRGAEISTLLTRLDEAAAALDEVLETCEGPEPKALLQLIDDPGEEGRPPRGRQGGGPAVPRLPRLVRGRRGAPRLKGSRPTCPRCRRSARRAGRHAGAEAVRGRAVHGAAAAAPRPARAHAAAARRRRVARRGWAARCSPSTRRRRGWPS